MSSAKKQIYYSDKYSDEEYEYRWGISVVLFNSFLSSWRETS